MALTLTVIILAAALGCITLLLLVLACLFIQRRKDARLHKLQRISTIEKAFPNSPLSNPPKKHLLEDDIDECITGKIFNEYRMGVESIQPAIPAPIYQRYLPHPTPPRHLKPLDLTNKSTTFPTRRQPSRTHTPVYPVPHLTFHSLNPNSKPVSTSSYALLNPHPTLPRYPSNRSRSISPDTTSIYSAASAPWYMHEEILKRRRTEALRQPLPTASNVAPASSRGIQVSHPQLHSQPTQQASSLSLRRKHDLRAPTVQKKSLIRRTNSKRSIEGLRLAVTKPLRVVNRTSATPSPGLNSEGSPRPPLSSVHRLDAPANVRTTRRLRRSLSSSTSFPPPMW